MKRRLIRSAFAVILAIAAFTGTARAGSAPNTLTVQANVLGVCTIDAALLDFLNYDPTAGNVDASADITVHCTEGTNYWIGLGLGNNPSGTTRRMAGGAGEFLTYELYRDAPGGTVWDNTDGGLPHSIANAGLPGSQPYTTTVFGRIAGGQVVGTGAYSDGVTMTVNF